MEYDAEIQSILDMIDSRIKENIRIDELARAVNYSTYHFCRVFEAVTGAPVMKYITRRKLEYAQYELSQSRRIIDVAMDYGFDTHAGFTKAFKKCYGFPPSLCYLRITPNLPARATIGSAKLNNGGIYIMNPHISEMTPFTVAGRTLRRSLPNVKKHADIPAFCFTKESERDSDNLLIDIDKLFARSNAIKHCEISICYDVDEKAGEFTYLLGRGIFDPNDLKNIQPGMVSIEISGLYAVFSTPLVPFQEHDLYAKVIKDTWSEIFTKWFPSSEFEYDESRKDFEYYDHRDHGWFFQNKRQMDICIPIKEREEARLKSQEKDKILWEHEMDRREQ